VAPRRGVFAFVAVWVEVGSGIARVLRRRRLGETVVESERGGRPRGLAMRVAWMII
jgi:hypothetical protein